MIADRDNNRIMIVRLRPSGRPGQRPGYLRKPDGLQLVP